MENLGNKIKSLKSIFGSSSSIKISLSELKRKRNLNNLKKNLNMSRILLLQKVIQLKLIQLKLTKKVLKS